MGSIQTVLGPIPPEDLGITLSHEHILFDGSYAVAKPRNATMLEILDQPVSLRNLGKVLRNVDACRDNLMLNDMETAIEELQLYKRSGGKSVVDVTVAGNGRDPIALAKISRATGLNIIVATGQYAKVAHTEDVEKSGVAELSYKMIREIEEGIDDSGIKAGIIKCGCSYPIHPDEKKVLQVAARAQEQTGAPITFHPPGRDIEKKKRVKKIEDALDILQEGGAELKKVYISHLQGWGNDLEYNKYLLDEYDAYLSYDGFSVQWFLDFIWPGCGKEACDVDLVDMVVELCNQGYDKRIMLAHDICMKFMLTRYGGWGYAHILDNIVPQFGLGGLSDRQITNMLIENPKRMLAF